MVEQDQLHLEDAQEEQEFMEAVEDVQEFVFGIPEGLVVEEAYRRSQCVSWTLTKYKGCDNSGGHNDAVPVFKKDIRPRNRKSRHSDAKYRTRSGPADILQYEKED